MSKKINASVIGATGYTGLELIRLLAAHPNIDLKHIQSASNIGAKISDVWPHLEGVCDLELSGSSLTEIAGESDVIFLALPHGEAANMAGEISGLTKIIDLSADFRDGNSGFLYGVPEINGGEVASAQNIANPGCFAIATELALWPLSAVIANVDVFGITGSSGSGKSLSEGTHHPVRSHNVKSYKIGVHQHTAEIIKTLGLDGGKFLLVPTSGPFTRGIQITAFVELAEKMNESAVLELFTKAYAGAPFVRIKKEVQIADVVGSNFCDIAINVFGKKVVVQSVIDNLVKGASGTAIQNCNLMFGLEETAGLASVGPLFP